MKKSYVSPEIIVIDLLVDNGVASLARCSGNYQTVCACD